METAATTNDSRSLSCAAECCVPVSISSEVLECRPAARLYLTELRRSPTTHRPRLRLANRPTPPLIPPPPARASVIPHTRHTPLSSRTASEASRAGIHIPRWRGWDSACLPVPPGEMVPGLAAFAARPG